MKRLVRFTGVTYYDLNGNGIYDPADPDDEDSVDEAVQVDRVVLRGIQDRDAFPNGTGVFDEEFNPYDNYTVLVDFEIPDDETATQINWYHNSTLALTSDTEMNIPLEKRLRLSGRVFWEKERPDGSSDLQNLEDVNITIEAEDGSATYEVTSNEIGAFTQWLRIGIDGNGSYKVRAQLAGFEPEEDYWEHRINASNMSIDLRMHPLNVTLNGTTFIDENGNGEMNRYEVPVKVEHIEIWDSNNVSIHFVTESDDNGTFSVTLPPGDYDVYAWTENAGPMLVHLMPHHFEPSGEALDTSLPMTIGRTMSGIMYYWNHTDANHTVEEVNLTFTQVDGTGRVPVTSFSDGSYEIALPEGRYRINGSFEDSEFGVEMTYEFDDVVRMVLKDAPDKDLNFTKVNEWLLDIWWDDVPIFLDENATYNFTVYAKNVGSVNDTFDITLEVPSDWIWTAEVTNVSLNLSQQTHFWVQVNVSKEALAEPWTVTITATPRNGTSEPSTLEVVFTINQHYGFELTEAEGQLGSYIYETDTQGNPRRRVTYFFNVANLGNGKEELTFSVSEISGWEIEMPQTSKELNGYERGFAIPIEIILPMRDEMNPQVLRITATAQNAPGNPTETFDLQCTFPELTAKKKDISGDDDGEPLKWPSNEAPAFTTVVALTALAMVALVADRRRREARP